MAVLCGQSLQLVTTPWAAACQAPLSTRSPRQEYWGGLSFPPPADLPDPEIEPTSSALARGFFTTEPPGKPPFCGYPMLCLVAPLCPTLCDPWPVAYQGPLSMGILQARIFESVSVPSSRGSSQTRDQIQISLVADGFFTL